MDKEEIYQLMDIEKGEDFKYFESLASGTFSKLKKG